MSSLDTPKCEPSCPDKSPKYLFALLVLLNVVLGIGVVRYVSESDLDADEVEHAHVTWAMNQGIMPYRDISQNHTPLLWIVSAPIMASLPQNVVTLIVLRGLCLLALAGTYLCGLLVLREILGPLNRTGALVLLLLVLAVYSDFEFYRYRPDPFMTLCVSCAILAAVRIGRAPRWYATISGLALGLAASFSPKMAPLCLLVPVLCLLECRRRWAIRAALFRSASETPRPTPAPARETPAGCRRGNRRHSARRRNDAPRQAVTSAGQVGQPVLGPLLLVIPNALGFIAGVLPMAAWLFFQGLLGSFWKWAVVLNSHMLNRPQLSVANVLEHANLILFLAVLGGWLVVRPKSGAWKMPWPPAAGVVVAAVLAWLTRITEPTHLSYNLQTFAMPAAVLGTVLIMQLAQWDAWPWGRRFALVGLTLAFIVGSEALHGISPKDSDAATIRRSDLQQLIDLIPSGKATCVGFTPWHPIFCRDATDLYAHRALIVLLQDWASPEGRKPFLEMWARAIPDIERREPDLIVDRMWVWACQGQVLSQQQYDRLVGILASRYHSVNAGEVPVFVKNQP